MSRLLAAAVAGLLLLVACGSSGGDSDLQAVAGAIREVETKGAGFTFTETLSQTGGDIPKGKTTTRSWCCSSRTAAGRPPAPTT